MDNKQHYIYVYIRKDTNDVCYIGKGVNKRDKKITQHNTYCQRIAQKYGIKIQRIKEHLTKEEANIAENIGVSSDALYKKFQKSKGKPIEIIINDKKLHFVRILK